MTDTPDTGPSPDRASQARTADQQTGPRPTAVGNPIASQSPDAPLSLEDVFDILRNERRQHVLSYVLITDEEQVTIGDLAEHIAAIENDISIQALSSQQRKRVYVALYQCHLPKMASANVIEFDKDRGIVEPGQNIHQLEPYFDVPGVNDDQGNSTPVHYLLLTAAAIVAYLLAAGLRPGGRLAGGVVLLAGVTAFVVFAYRTRST